jgi:DUF4097 and DUF4098 domain-containing protein YvlB
MMMSKTVLSLTLCAMVAGAAPAAAQSQRARVRVDAREGRESIRPVLYQQGRDEQTDRQTKTLKLGASGELVLHNVSGDILVTRSSGADVTLEIVKTARGRTADDARAMLGLVDVTVTERAGRAEVKTVYPQGDSWRRENRGNVNVSVAYTVAAPAGTRVAAASVSGNIKVTDIKGEVSATTVSGGVRIANAGRIGSAKSVSGSVEIFDTQGDSEVDAQSVSGNVLLRKVTARRVDAGSVSGNIILTDVQSDGVEAHSVSGNVEYTGVLAKKGHYELRSHSGDVRLGVGTDAGFELEANSFSGSVRSDLPLTLGGRDGGDRGNRKALRGTYGDGSAVISATTFSGNIVISKR